MDPMNGPKIIITDQILTLNKIMRVHGTCQSTDELLLSANDYLFSFIIVKFCLLFSNKSYLFSLLTFCFEASYFESKHNNTKYSKESIRMF